jgi:hypothetical protein
MVPYLHLQAQRLFQDSQLLLVQQILQKLSLLVPDEED